MAVKKKRQEILCEALGGSVGSHRKLFVRDINTSKYYDDIKDIYRRLGGVLLDIPCLLRKGDIELPDIIVELDEEQHFNRYRLVTLESPLYSELNKFPLNEYK